MSSPRIDVAGKDARVTEMENDMSLAIGLVIVSLVALLVCAMCFVSSLFIDSGLLDEILGWVAIGTFLIAIGSVIGAVVLL